MPGDMTWYLEKIRYLHFSPVRTQSVSGQDIRWLKDVILCEYRFSIIYLKQNYLMNQQKIRSGISDISILSGHKMVCFFEIQVSIEVWDTRSTS